MTTAAVTGTALNQLAPAIFAGGLTIIITLTDDTWVGPGGTFNAVRQDIVLGIQPGAALLDGWPNIETALIADLARVVRTSATVVTITLPVEPVGYTETTGVELMTVTVPAAAMATEGEDVIAAPTFTIGGTEEPEPEPSVRRLCQITRLKIIGVICSGN